MLKLLILVGWPNVRRHRMRTALTILGIALGVGIFFAIRTANANLKLSLRDTIDKIAGKAQLQVTMTEVGMPETLLEEIRKVPGVRVAVPIIEVVTRPREVRESSLLILGVDLTGDRQLRDYDFVDGDEAMEDPLLFLAQPDSLCVSRDFAERNGLDFDDPLELSTPAGVKSFIVRGMMEPRGMATAFGGNVAVMDIYAAQFVFGRGQRFDRIDVATEEGESITAVQERLQKKLPAGYHVAPPYQRGRQMEALVSSFSASLALSSILAVLVGVLLIFNLFAVAVTERRREIGILRAVGASRGDVQRFFLGESLILSLVGSALGLFLGALVAPGLMRFMARVVEQTYGFQTRVRSLALEPHLVLVGLAVGASASLLGAYFPARDAARVDPARALQKGKYQNLHAGDNPWRRRMGLLLLGTSVGIFAVPWFRSEAWVYVAFLLSFLGLSLFVPWASRWLVRRFRSPLRWVSPLEGLLASDSLLQAPRRTSATVGALMFSLAFVISTAGSSQSIKGSLTEWLDQSVNADLFINANENMVVRHFQFPAEMAGELKKVPGVRQVDSVRIINYDHSGLSLMLISIEIDQFLNRAHFLTVEGEEREIGRRLVDRDAVVISDNLSVLHDWHRGDTLSLRAPSGDVRFEIAGVTRDYSSDRGSIFMDRRTFIKHWKDDRADVFDLMLHRGFSQDRVKEEIASRFRDQRRLFILTNGEMRREIMLLIDQLFSLMYLQVLVAILVAVLGIINALYISIHERKREIGVLKAIGGVGRQVRKTFVLEGVCISLVATTLGCSSGAVLAYVTLQTLSRTFAGWILPFRFPFGVAAALFPAMALVAALASWYPAHRAVRMPATEAIAYE